MTEPTVDPRATTPTYGWRVPILGDVPNVPGDMTNLALDIEATVRAGVTGMVAPFAGAAAPAGWLLCQGQAVSRTTYSALYAVCGVVYGVGDGSTTFNVPNLKGRVPVGVDAAQTEFNGAGKTGGTKTHQHSSPFPLHPQASGTGAAHTVLPHNTSVYGMGTQQVTYPNIARFTATSEATSAAGYPFLTSAGDSLQPYVALNYLIKT